MKLQSIAALVLALGLACPAAAQVTPGSSPLSVAKGGTAGATAAAARTNLAVPGLTTSNIFSGTNNFTGPFQIGGTAQTFPTSGSLVGTSDSQSLSNKTLLSPLVTGPLVVSGTGGSISATGADASFSAGGNRAFMDAVTGNIRMGALNGGGAAVGLQFVVNGVVQAGFTSAGNLTISGVTTFSSAINYGGVLLSNSVTGTGSMVLSSGATLANPIISGASPSGTAGTIGYTAGLINWYDGASVRTALAADTVQTVTNKTINAANNTLTGTASGLTAGAVPASGITGTTLASNVVTSSITQVGSSLGVNGAASGRTAQVNVASTASSANQLQIKGYQASLEVMNQAANANFYFGVNDASSNELWIGGGYSAGQGINPSMVIDSVAQVSFGIGASRSQFSGGFPGTFSVTDNIVSTSNPWLATFISQGKGTSGYNGNYFTIGAYSGGAISPQPSLQFIGLRGTIAAPAAVKSGDILGVLGPMGYDGSSFSTWLSTIDYSAQISWYTTQDWTSTAHGTQTRFTYVPNNTRTITLGWVLDQDGSFNSGNSSGGSKGPGTISAAGSLSIASVSTVNSGTASITIGDASLNAGSYLRYQGSSTQYNWQQSSNAFVSNTLEWTPSTATGGITFTTPVMKLTPTGALTVNTSVTTVPTVVNSLPACTAGLDGARAFVTNNATATSFGGAVTTGGTNHHLVYCDGSATAWKQG